MVRSQVRQLRLLQYLTAMSWIPAQAMMVVMC